MNKIEMALLLMPTKNHIARHVPEITLDLNDTLRELNQARDMINDALFYASNARLTLEDALDEQVKSGLEVEEPMERTAKRSRVGQT